MKNVILQGDALSKLKELPEKSVNMCMTSPPYWALRDYGVDGQLGLEPTFDQYINDLCDIFDEVKRVLKDDGTCWVNLGDSYNNSTWARGKDRFDKKVYNLNKMEHGRGGQKGYPDKCLAQIPFRFAIEMVNRGWILRNTIIWYKPNCMPSSVKDRFTVDFEYLFFFSKKKKYYFEQQYESVKECSIKRLERAVSNKHKNLDVPGQTLQGMHKPRLNVKNYKRYEKSKAPHEFDGSDHLVSPFDPKRGRNKRTTWRICPKPFKEAHFAVYPEELCETPIKAGCPEGGIVLDPFFGAGTTGVVALKQNKNFLGIELNPEYIKIAEKRLKPLLDQTTLSLNKEKQND